MIVKDEVKGPRPLTNAILTAMNLLSKPATVDEIHETIVPDRDWKRSSVANDLNDFSASVNHEKAARLYNVVRPILFVFERKSGQRKKLWSLTDVGRRYVEDLRSANDEIAATTREVVIAIRKRQAAFRRAVLQRWKGRCSVTGLSEPELLVAAHIKPWALSNDAERVDPENGLLLDPLHDRLFDKYLITFRLNTSGDVALECQEFLKIDALRQRGLIETATLSNISSKMRQYLKHHNSYFDEESKSRR